MWAGDGGRGGSPDQRLWESRGLPFVDSLVVTASIPVLSPTPTNVACSRSGERHPPAPRDLDVGLVGAAGRRGSLLAAGGKVLEWSLVWEAREPHGQSGLETQEDFCESLVVGVVAVLRGVAVMQRKSWLRTWRDCLNASR